MYLTLSPLLFSLLVKSSHPKHDFKTGMLIENSTVPLLPAYSTALYRHRQTHTLLLNIHTPDAVKD